MVGYVTEAVASALKGWERLKGANVFVVRATEGDSVVVNTTPPAVAIHVKESSDHEPVFIGGDIRQFFELQLYCMLPLNNYTFSDDKGLQAKMLDLSDEVLRCMERSFIKGTDGEQPPHDWNMIYDRTDYERAYGMKGSLSIVVDIHKICYRGSVEFDPYVPDGKPEAPVQEIDLTVKYEGDDVELKTKITNA